MSRALHVNRPCLYLYLLQRVSLESLGSAPAAQVKRTSMAVREGVGIRYPGRTFEAQLRVFHGIATSDLLIYRFCICHKSTCERQWCGCKRAVSSAHYIMNSTETRQHSPPRRTPGTALCQVSVSERVAISMRAFLSICCTTSPSRSYLCHHTSQSQHHTKYQFSEHKKYRGRASESAKDEH